MRQILKVKDQQTKFTVKVDPGVLKMTVSAIDGEIYSVVEPGDVLKFTFESFGDLVYTQGVVEKVELRKFVSLKIKSDG